MLQKGQLYSCTLILSLIAFRCRAQGADRRWSLRIQAVIELSKRLRVWLQLHPRLIAAQQVCHTITIRHVHTRVQHLSMPYGVLPARSLSGSHIPSLAGYRARLVSQSITRPLHVPSGQSDCGVSARGLPEDATVPAS